MFDKSTDREPAATDGENASSGSEITDRIARLALLIEQQSNAIASSYGLSHKGDLDTLRALRRQPPPHQLSPTQLAADSMMTTGGMTSRLDRLESADLVQRLRNPEDRRALLVRLTAVGVDVVDAALESTLIWQNRLFESIPPQQIVMLHTVLEQLLHSFDDGRLEI